MATSCDGTIGVLVSGGLDSSILVSHLVEQGHQVQPLYIQSGLRWQEAELSALGQYLAATAHPRLQPLVLLELPLGDLYAGHWSLGNGQPVPGASTADDAVFLPGRNALLLIKAALWCQMQGIAWLALAPLANNPFADATDEFFARFEQMLSCCGQGAVRIVRPFGTWEKPAVMRLGRGLPLTLTFSCIDPQAGLHCGKCNKCAERQAAFALAALPDTTCYALRPTNSSGDPLSLGKRSCFVSPVKSTSATATG
jgi:7-cyano-7-deazaguanine synthase